MENTNAANVNAIERITKDDIPHYAPNSIDLPNGWTAEIRTEIDESSGMPWKDEDGHGRIRDGRIYDGNVVKRPTERVLWRDRRDVLLYDFAEAVKLARRDGWGCPHVRATIDYDNGGTSYKYDRGGHASRGEMAACAAEHDFDRMRQFATGHAYYIGVIVTVKDAEGETVDDASLWGIESDSDYWREVAAELINEVCAGVVLPTHVG